MTRWRRALVRGAIGVCAAVAALAVVEGAASAWLMVEDVRDVEFDVGLHANVYDSLLGWGGEPNAHRTAWFEPGMTLTHNADGMRIQRPVTPALAPGMRRAICSGDSFTHGWGVGDQETYCAYLENELPGFETLNMGRGGYGIDQAYLWYKRDAARYPHQLHIFAFIWHDFERAAMHSFWGRPKPYLGLKGDSVVVTNLPLSTNGWSPRWTYAAQFLPRLRIFQLITRRLDKSERADLARTETAIWNVAEGMFRDLDRLNRERGSQLALVYLPTTSDLIPSPHDARRARLAAFATRANLVFIDLTDALRAVPPDTSQWYFITPNHLSVRGATGHYTPEGNRWAARELARRLREIPATAAVTARTVAVR